MANGTIHDLRPARNIFVSRKIPWDPGYPFTLLEERQDRDSLAITTFDIEKITLIDVGSLIDVKEGLRRFAASGFIRLDGAVANQFHIEQDKIPVEWKEKGNVTVFGGDVLTCWYSSESLVFLKGEGGSCSKGIVTTWDAIPLKDLEFYKNNKIRFAAYGSKK